MESTFIELIVFFINKISYFGLYILMCLESTALPLPSELILPFSGWVLVKDSSIIQITNLTIIASLGSVTGSLIEYYIAKTLGRAFFIKYGKYIFDFWNKNGVLNLSVPKAEEVKSEVKKITVS